MISFLKKHFFVLYEKIVKIDDSPQKIALGCSLGVFLGVLPGLGPLAALGLAMIFRVNKAAAFLGSFITNTWLTLVTFVLAIRIGTSLLNLPWIETREQIKNIFTHFHWRDFFDTAILQILKPLALGYLVIASLGALIAYVMVCWIIALRKKV